MDDFKLTKIHIFLFSLLIGIDFATIKQKEVDTRESVPKRLSDNGGFHSWYYNKENAGLAER